MMRVMKKDTQQEIEDFLELLNKKYYSLHKKYEDLFWKVYMQDPSLNEKMNIALRNRDAFGASEKNLSKVREMRQSATKKLSERLGYWELYFGKNQVPEHMQACREAIATLEGKISKKVKVIKEGYKDPKTGKFTKMPYLQMRQQMVTNDNESLRKAFFESGEERAETVLGEYIELVSLRNEFAKGLGYEDFYAYKTETEEGMSKKDIFDIFDDIYDSTRYAFADVREMAKSKKGLRKPWNFGFMLAGDFIKEEDKYLQFESILSLWGRSFTALGIDYAGGELKLDLLDRENKYNNGFCQWPILVTYKEGKRVSASANFTCNAVIGQVGSGSEALNTLFHEGGHAAHLLNSKMQDTCINHEYPPQSTAWAETQSMFLDTISSSIEWRVRYAKDAEGESYPFGLFKKRVEQNHKIIPLSMMGISSVMYFERSIYEEKNLTVEKALKIAKRISKKFGDKTVTSISVLNVPHIYSFESACSYHGYGLAEIALTQWRAYLYKKYGHIVDNKNVGREMKKVWAGGSSKTFAEFVRIATGKKLSADSYMKSVTSSKGKILSIAKKRIKALDNVKKQNKINLKANISLWHGKKRVADNKDGFEEMVNKYNHWITKTF